MRQYDVIIIGAGTGGQTAAYTLAEEGLKVAVVEKSERPGGVCALAGCQAKKWFYEAAETIARAWHLSGLGIESPAMANWNAIMAQKRLFTEKVPENTVKGLQGSGIDLIRGAATFTSPDTLVVDGHELKADYYIIATGAAPMPLPVKGSRHVMTSDAFLELESLPKRLLFVGGGFISFEFAHFAARLAQTESITILEAAPLPLNNFDADIVKELVSASKEEGIDIITNVKISRISEKAGCLLVTTEKHHEFEADLVVHGAGRAPFLDGLGLDRCDVAYIKKGITVDASMRTTNPRIFAVGDCAATMQLARVADFEAYVAAKNILAGKNRVSAGATVDPRAIPSLLFTYPQCGMVGETEAQLKERGASYDVRFEKNISWPTYKRIGMKWAAYKILIDDDRRILGAHILSDNAAGLITLFKDAMLDNLPVEKVYWRNIMTPYPSRESDVVYMLRPFLEADAVEALE